MKNLYVIGGKQKSPRSFSAGNQEWNGYEKGLIVQVDTEARQASVCTEYSSPPEVCASADHAVLFQAATLENQRLYVCTQTEIMVYSVPDFEQQLHISLPWFNDLHHVRPTPEGTLLAANAGLEMILEVTPAGEVLRVWNVLGEEPWARFSPEIDYRRVSTKPHRSHPNYIFYINDEIWVTRFQQGDAISLTNPSKYIQISSERIHDGLYHDGYIYFTTVSGKIVVVNANTLSVEEMIDLNRMHPVDTLLGWCRSLLLDGDKLWVGFSRIRPTKFRENVTFVMRGFKRSLPTHVACYDLKQMRCLTEIDLEPVGLSAIFSIFPAAEQVAAIDRRFA